MTEVVEMATLYDHDMRQIRVGDRVKFHGRTDGSMGTVTGLRVKRVEVRWDKRGPQALHSTTRVAAELLQVCDEDPATASAGRPAWFEAAASAYVCGGRIGNDRLQAACEVAVRAELESMAEKIRARARTGGTNDQHVLEWCAKLCDDRADELEGT